MTIETNNQFEQGLAGQYDFNIRAMFSEAWQKVKGVKGAYWGGVGLYTAVAFAVNILLIILFGILMFIFAPSSFDHSAQMGQGIQQQPMTTSVLIIQK